MWLTSKSTKVWSCFACEINFSLRVYNIQIHMYFGNFYVYNALHGATLANCSPLSICIRIETQSHLDRCKSLHRRNSLRRTLYHLHNWEIYPCSTKDNFDRCPVIYSWITILRPCQTHGKVHNRSGIQHSVLYRTYDWCIGNDFHSLSTFCRGRVLSLTQLHTLQHRQELLLWLFHFELFQNLVKVCTDWKKLIKRLDLSL